MILLKKGPVELKTQYLQSSGWYEIEQETGFFGCSQP